MSPESPATWPLTVRSPASLCMECVLCSLIEGPRAYRRVMSLAPPDTLSGLARESVVRGWKRACPSGHKSAGKASLYLQRAPLPPTPLPWFTAPTETKLGTATVSAPGPLSSSQDELFAEDIQMYKEQIRLTQSSFARREEKKEREPADFKKTSFPRLLEWVKGFGNENSLVYSKC